MIHKVRRFWHHRLHITLAVHETGRTKAFTPRSRHVLASIVGLVSVLTIGLMSATQRPEPKLSVSLPAHLSGQTSVMDALQSRIIELEDQKSFRDEQLKVFAQQVGVLQARLSRFDAIGERLFNDEYFGKYLQDMAEYEAVGSPEIPTDDRIVSLFEVANQLSSLQRKSEQVADTMETSLDLLTKTQLNRAQQPHIWPVVNERTYLSSKYGWRTDPFSDKRRWHAGIDIAGGFQAPIVAAAEGVVKYAGYRYGYGHMVELQHAGGFVTRYGHLNKVLVKNGQTLKGGEMIALMGSSGRSTGPHLHFEVLLGDHKVDPTPFVIDGKQNARMLAKNGKFQQAHLH